MTVGLKFEKNADVNGYTIVAPISKNNSCEIYKVLDSRNRSNILKIVQAHPIQPLSDTNTVSCFQWGDTLCQVFRCSQERECQDYFSYLSEDEEEEESEVDVKVCFDESEKKEKLQNGRNGSSLRSQYRKIIRTPIPKCHTTLLSSSSDEEVDDDNETSVSSSPLQKDSVHDTKVKPIIVSNDSETNTKPIPPAFLPSHIKIESPLHKISTKQSKYIPRTPVPAKTTGVMTSFPTLFSDSERTDHFELKMVQKSSTLERRKSCAGFRATADYSSS